MFVLMADRRRAAGGRRDRDALRRRARRGRDRGPRRAVAGRGDRGGHARLSRRLARRLGARQGGRAAADRAPRALAAPRPGALRARRALVRSLRRLVRALRPAAAAGALVRLDPRRACSSSRSAATCCSAGSRRWCGASRSASPGTRSGSNWESVHHAFRYLDYVAVAGVIAVAAFLLGRMWRAR